MQLDLDVKGFRWHHMTNKPFSNSLSQGCLNTMRWSQVMSICCKGGGGKGGGGGGGKDVGKYPSWTLFIPVRT